MIVASAWHRGDMSHCQCWGPLVSVPGNKPSYLETPIIVPSHSYSELLWWQMWNYVKWIPVNIYPHCSCMNDVHVATARFCEYFSTHIISKEKCIIHVYQRINSLRPSDAYICGQPRQSLVQIMACRLFGAKPLYEPMLSYCQLNPLEQTSVKFESKFKHFHPRKRIW